MISTGVAAAPANADMIIDPLTLPTPLRIKAALSAKCSSMLSTHNVECMSDVPIGGIKWLRGDNRNVVDLHSFRRPPRIREAGGRLFKEVAPPHHHLAVAMMPDSFALYVSLLDGVAVALERGDWRTAHIGLFEGGAAGVHPELGDLVFGLRCITRNLWFQSVEANVQSAWYQLDGAARKLGIDVQSKL